MPLFSQKKKTLLVLFSHESFYMPLRACPKVWSMIKTSVSETDFLLWSAAWVSKSSLAMERRRLKRSLPEQFRWLDMKRIPMTSIEFWIPWHNVHGPISSKRFASTNLWQWKLESARRRCDYLTRKLFENVCHRSKTNAVWFETWQFIPKRFRILSKLATSGVLPTGFIRNKETALSLSLIKPVGETSDVTKPDSSFLWLNIFQLLNCIGWR